VDSFSTRSWKYRREKRERGKTCWREWGGCVWEGFLEEIATEVELEGRLMPIRGCVGKGILRKQLVQRSRG
jgi:hypothetical protein